VNDPRCNVGSANRIDDALHQGEPNAAADSEVFSAAAKVETEN